jgi:hypothetical protein
LAEEPSCVPCDQLAQKEDVGKRRHARPNFIILSLKVLWREALDVKGLKKKKKKAISPYLSAI